MKHMNPWLDVVRSTAIIFVLMSHSRGLLVEEYPVLSFMKFGGFVGVELFFVLSGFLIGGVLSRMGGFDFRGVKIFFLRRWFRTLPNYYLFLFLAVLFSFAGIRSEEIPGNLAEYFFFAQNLYSPHPGFFGEAWSLSVEEVFYFLFPVLVMGVTSLVKMDPKKVMVFLGGGIFVFCTLARMYVAEIPDVSRDFIRKAVLLRMDSIMVGVLVAILWARWSRFF